MCEVKNVAVNSPNTWLNITTDSKDTLIEFDDVKTLKFVKPKFNFMPNAESIVAKFKNVDVLILFSWYGQGMLHL